MRKCNANSSLNVNPEHSISNFDIASLFSNMATSLLFQNEKKNLFRILAYKKAAEVISASVDEFYDLWRENKLTGIAGIGEGMRAYLDELFNTGHIKEIDNEVAKFPWPVYFLQKIRGIGPKTALALSRELRITNYELRMKKNNINNEKQDNTKSRKNKRDTEHSIRGYPLEIRGNPGLKKQEEIVINQIIKLCKDHEISKLEGFGEKSESEILQAVIKYQQGASKGKRINLSDALKTADKIINYMKILPEVKKIEALGSLRRKCETVGDIDIAVATTSPEVVINHFLKFRHEKILEQGENKAAIVFANGTQVDLRVIPPDQWGTILAHFTGSKEHNVKIREYAMKKGLSISEYGIKINQKSKIKNQNDKSKLKNVSVDHIQTFATEEAFYRFLDLQYILPELRENTDEINLAINNKLPKLINLQDIKGDLHLHTNFDIESSHDLGADGPERIIEEAKKRGYKYLAFSEHNPSLSKHNKNQVAEILKRKQELVNKLNNKQNDIYIFNSLEVDILPNGELAIEEEHTKYLDFIIASIHSSFDQNKEAQTKRILKALKFTKVKIFGHPTGRMVQKRDAIQFDHDAVFQECVKRSITVEISASSYRSDPPWPMIKHLKSLGVMFIINTDAHSKEELDNMKFGVWNGRKGWLEARNVINTQDLGEIRKYFLN